MLPTHSKILSTTAAALLMVVQGLSADTSSQLADPREAALAEIRREITQLENRLGQARNRERTLENDLAGTRLELELQQKQLAEATAALDLAGARAADATARIAELEQALEGVSADFERRTHGLYRLGRQGYLRLFLSLSPESKMLPAIRQLRYLVRRDQLAIERFRATRDALAEERQQLASHHQAMAEWQAEESVRRDQLVDVQKRLEGLLKKTAEERRKLAARTDALQEKEQKLVRLIGSLAGEVLEGVPIQDFRGVLDWPLEGDLVGRFGARRDPRYRTEVPHNGIDIAPTSDQQVRTVYPGKVLFAAHFDGYGKMVVVHHAGRAFTLYAGLQELKVERDDTLPLGAVIGTAADQLYFEIRQEQAAEDPLQWLR